jgi:hypothetical protein
LAVSGQYGLGELLHRLYFRKFLQAEFLVLKRGKQPGCPAPDVQFKGGEFGVFQVAKERYFCRGVE